MKRGRKQRPLAETFRAVIELLEAEPEISAAQVALRLGLRKQTAQIIVAGLRRDVRTLEKSRRPRRDQQQALYRCRGLLQLSCRASPRVAARTVPEFGEGRVRLTAWTRHHQSCPARLGGTPETLPCTCGLDEAIAASMRSPGDARALQRRYADALRAAGPIYGTEDLDALFDELIASVFA